MPEFHLGISSWGGGGGGGGGGGKLMDHVTVRPRRGEGRLIGKQGPKF